MLLEIKNLSISLNTDEGPLEVNKNISLQLKENESLGIIGESGSGKSMLALSLLSLLDNDKIFKKGGEILFEGKDIMSYSEDQLIPIRGPEIAIIFQEPVSSFNPLFSIGYHLLEALNKIEKDIKKNNEKAIELLHQVDIKNPEEVMNKYPHQLSGGMLQRVMIAIALAFKPKVLIADEPTTALDVTVQYEIIKLLKRLKSEYKMSMIIISHDLGVIKQLCSNVVVMNNGNIVERGSISSIIHKPVHPYTKELINAHISLEKSDFSKQNK